MSVSSGLFSGVNQQLCQEVAALAAMLRGAVDATEEFANGVVTSNETKGPNPNGR